MVDLAFLVIVGFLCVASAGPLAGAIAIASVAQELKSKRGSFHCEVRLQQAIRGQFKQLTPVPVLF